MHFLPSDILGLDLLLLFLGLESSLLRIIILGHLGALLPSLVGGKLTLGNVYEILVQASLHNAGKNDDKSCDYTK